MNRQNVIVVGGPDAGKTNYIGRLWISLRSGRRGLKALELPDHIEYIEQVVEHLNSGRFAPRSERRDFEARDVVLPIATAGQPGHDALTIAIPDVSGELWRNAVEARRIQKEWISLMSRSVGALIFVRVRSSDNSAPVDWVTAAELMPYGEQDSTNMPTQVMLCEFLQLVETYLPTTQFGAKARIGVVVSAWDLLDPETSANSPRLYLEKEYPLFAGRLCDIAERFEVMVFGNSIVGGDLDDEEFQRESLAKDLDSMGFVMMESSGRIMREEDLTLPLAWIAGLKSIA